MTDPLLSICMIFKDEEQFLPEFLDCCQPYADQLVLVDTGSTDQSLAICKGRGIEPELFPWSGNFSEAKNFALSKARGHWVLFLDADERICREDFIRLRDQLTRLEGDGYFIKVISTRTREWKSSNRKLQSVQNHLRLFRNHQGYEYRYKIHEVIIESIEQKGGRTQDLERVFIYHLGYCDDLMELKIARNIPLIEREYQEDPQDPRNILYYAFSKMGPQREVLELLKEGFRNSHRGFALELCQAILEWFLDFGDLADQEINSWKAQMNVLQEPSAAVAILEGRVAFANEDIVSAYSHYYKAQQNLNQFPHGKYHHEVLDRLIVLAAMQGDFSAALKFSMEYIAFHGRTAGIYHLLAKLTFVMRDFDRFREEVLNTPEDIGKLEERKRQEIYAFAQSSPHAADEAFLERLERLLGIET